MMIRNCLLLDDNDICLRVFAKHLCSIFSTPSDNSSFNVDQATNGWTAVGMVLTSTYQLVVTDFSMPHMNGLEFVKHVRKINQKVPIAVVTSDSLSEKTLRTLRKFGIVGVWKKPIQHDGVMEIVCQAMDELNRLAVIDSEAGLPKYKGSRSSNLHLDQEDNIVIETSR